MKFNPFQSTSRSGLLSFTINQSRTDSDSKYLKNELQTSQNFNYFFLSKSFKILERSDYTDFSSTFGRLLITII